MQVRFLLGRHKKPLFDGRGFLVLGLSGIIGKGRFLTNLKLGLTKEDEIELNLTTLRYTNFETNQMLDLYELS